jgi:ankyrin repeat protein
MACLYVQFLTIRTICTPSYYRRDASVATVRLLIAAWPAGIKAKDVDGKTPLHIGVEHNAPSEAIRLLVESW